MAIPYTAQFSHTVALQRSPDGAWRGVAESADQHSSLVGDAPAVQLSRGELTLERRSAPRPGPFRELIPESRVAMARFAVGDALEAVLGDGDVLHMDRGAMAELSLVLLRKGRLALALGAIDQKLERVGVTIEVDPRTDDALLYYVRSLLDRPDSQLVWLDPKAADYERQLAELGRIPPHVSMVSIAARCDDWQTSSAINQRALQNPPGRRHWGFNYETVATTFRTREEFVAYLRALPQQRPADFFLRFVAEGTVAELREGECRVHEPWLFSVHSVASRKDGWSRSQAGVARAHASLTPECLHTSVRLVVESPIQFA